MTQSNWSLFGSPLTLILEDEIAERYNAFAEAFFAAQEKHLAETGTPWEPTQQIVIDVPEETFAAYNNVGRLMNLLIEINGGSLNITEEMMTSDYLVKL